MTGIRGIGDDNVEFSGEKRGGVGEVGAPLLGVPGPSSNPTGTSGGDGVPKLSPVGIIPSSLTTPSQDCCKIEKKRA